MGLSARQNEWNVDMHMSEWMKCGYAHVRIVAKLRKQNAGGWFLASWAARLEPSSLGRVKWKCNSCSKVLPRIAAIPEYRITPVPGLFHHWPTVASGQARGCVPICCLTPMRGGFAPGDRGFRTDWNALLFLLNRCTSGSVQGNHHVLFLFFKIARYGCHLKI